MTLPPLLDRGRGRGLALVAALTLVQGGAAGAAAFATRGLFEAMHGRVALPVGALAILAGAGALIAVTRVAARYLGERIGQDYARQIRAALFDHAIDIHIPGIGGDGSIGIRCDRSKIDLKRRLPAFRVG